MKNKILLTIISVLAITLTSSAQMKSENPGYLLSIGKGGSFYKNIQSQQFILFYYLPELKGNFGKMSYESDLNFEYILANNKTTYVFGFAPMLRYNFNFLNSILFAKAGIGVNYLSSISVGNRSLGGHLIFSDMFSIGSRILNAKRFSIEISYLFRHISNAGIYNSNDGFNSGYLIISAIILQ